MPFFSDLATCFSRFLQYNTANISTVIGQLIAGVVINHFGWFGRVEISLDWKRWLALGSMMLALYFV
ncbi:DMT family transporter [Rossellomorea arthrocnemi]